MRRQKGFFFYKDSDEIIEQRWGLVLQTLVPLVLPVILARMFGELQSSQGTVVGDVRIDKTGFHKTGDYGILQSGAAQLMSFLGGDSPEERERKWRHLAWNHCGGVKANRGMIEILRIRDNGDAEEWASLNARESWNAVCLPHLLELLLT